MKLNPEELATQLAQGIKPVYLITGDEPYQCLDLVRQVRQATTAAGYGTRESYQVDAGFDWAPVQVSTTNLSLFAERKLIELRVNSMKAFKSGESILKDYTQHPSDDTVLLISLPRLEKRVKSQAWFSALEKMGVVIEVWPLERKQFVPWLRRHVRQEAMTIENDALETLADFVEGNLLAASQEISKLKALGLNHIDNKILLEQVSNSSKFGTEALLDACFGGDLERTVRILGSLGEAKEAQPLLLWNVARELRRLLLIKQGVSQGVDKYKLLASNQVFGPSKTRVESALRRYTETQLEDLLVRAAESDRYVKGIKAGNSWDELIKLIINIAQPNKELVSA